MLLYTSIPPRFSRKDPSGKEIGSEYLAACVTSWRENGFEPISINRPDEIEAVKGLGLMDSVPAKMTEALWPNRYGPALGDLFDALPADERIAYVNADIFMLRSNLANVLSGMHDHALVAARRCDVTGLGARSCETFQLGLDFMSFNPAHIAGITADTNIRRFQLGAPWWDYLFPAACQKVVGLRRLREPIIVHQLHPDRWDASIWRSLGLKAGQAIVPYFPLGFGPILENHANYASPARILAMAFQTRLFDDADVFPVTVSPCSHFARVPTLVEKPSQVPNLLLPPDIRTAAGPARDLPFLFEGKRQSWPRRSIHTIRDYLRTVRQRAGLS